MSSQNENEVKAILREMQADALAFRDEMERLAPSRCDGETLSNCARGNYNDCTSAYPGGRCVEPGELAVAACGGDDGASSSASCSGEFICTHAHVAKHEHRLR